MHNIDGPVVDLFAGGGGLWSNCKSNDVIVNDVLTPLIEFQKLVYDSTGDSF